MRLDICGLQQFTEHLMHSDVTERIATVGDKHIISANAESVSLRQISAQPFYCGLV